MIKVGRSLWSRPRKGANSYPYPFIGVPWEYPVCRVRSEHTLANGICGTEWASANGCNTLPANPISVAIYLHWCASSGAGQSALRLARAAIGAYHRDADLPDPTTEPCVKQALAETASSDAIPRLRQCAPPDSCTATTCYPLSNCGDGGKQLPFRVSVEVPESKKYGNSDFLKGLKSGHVPCYATAQGEAWVGDSRRLLKKIDDESIDLVVTSPQYGLLKKKEYGNENQDDYVKWFRPFAKEIASGAEDQGKSGD